jgi:hypothetical protein
MSLSGWCCLFPLLIASGSCRSPNPDIQAQNPDGASSTSYGRPVVLARTEGEARNFQGRRPLLLKVDPQTVGSRAFTVAMEDLPPGDSIGVHKHLQEDEVVFVYRGARRGPLTDAGWPLPSAV